MNPKSLMKSGFEPEVVPVVAAKKRESPARLIGDARKRVPLFLGRQIRSEPEQPTRRMLTLGAERL